MSITTVESVALADFESEFDWSQIELLAEEDRLPKNSLLKNKLM